MKIGILLKKPDYLANWELRVIKEIMDAPNLNIGLLAIDGRANVRTSNTFSTKSSFPRLLLKIQCGVERKIVQKEVFTVERNALFKQLEQFPNIRINPLRKDSSDLIDGKDSELIKTHDLDVIIALGFLDIKGDILNSAKYGVWSLRHGDDLIDKASPVGFWEITNKEPTVVVTLNQLAQQSDENILIDKAHFNKHWSLVKTSDMVLESSVAFLIKNLKRLQTGNLPIRQSLGRNISSLNSPNTFQIIGYLISFYAQLFRKFFERINTKLFGVRYDCFTLFLGEGDFLNTDRSELKPVNLPKNEFWADPFLFCFEDEVYVFFENYPYTTKRGKISCGKLKNGQIIEVQDVLDLDYHLSYPYIFEEKGGIYLMPESVENKNLTIYKCIEFPHRWEPFTTAFDDEFVADAFFHNDKSGQKWLFLNKASAASVPLQNELHIYKVDSLELLNQSVPHKQNPVIIDARTARNGGEIFEHENELYRPSQCNDEGIYGRALNINKIKKLTLDEYVEETIETIEPDFHEGLLATHHLHQIEGFFVIDAAYKRL